MEDAGDVAGLVQVRDDFADIEGTVDDRPSPGGAEHPDLRDQVPQLLEPVPGQRFVTGLGQRPTTPERVSCCGVQETFVADGVAEQLLPQSA